VSRAHTITFWVCMALAGADLPARDAPPRFESAPVGCLALVVYSEARSEPLFTQAVVASVVVERARKRRTDLCTEAMDTSQFHGMRDWPTPRKPWEQDAQAWRDALAISAAVADLSYEIPPPCAGSLFFHDDSVSPAWARSLHHTCSLDKLHFYN